MKLRALERRLSSLVMLAAMSLAACGGGATDTQSSGGESPDTSSKEGAGAGGAAASSETGAGNAGRQGLVSYPCVGGFVYLESGGTNSFAGAMNVEDVPWTGGSAGASSCVVGQAICHITSVPEIELGVPPTTTCMRLSGTLAACASTPNCACVCTHGVSCDEACSCTDTGGLATLSCQET